MASRPKRVQFLARRLNVVSQSSSVARRGSPLPFRDMYDMLAELDTISDVMGLRAADPLDQFSEMWYQVFLWSLFSSLFVHTCAALVAFATLRKHKFGKFFPVLLVVMGVVAPATSGAMSSAAIAFVYHASALTMTPVYAMVWGIGQTVLCGAVGFTRILATL